MFAPAKPLREKILLYGGAGAGKTTAILQIARAIQPQGNRVHVVDTDDGLMKGWALEFEDCENIERHRVYGFDQYIDVSERIRAEARDGDWVAVDMISHAWDSVQRYFTDQIFKKNLGEYFLEARRQMEERGGKKKKGSAFDGWQDWSVINGVYKDWIQPLIWGMPFHLIATASASTVGDDDEDEIRRLFPTGIKPAGQKHLPHEFDTVIFMESPKDREQKRRLATTFKDRGRKPFTDELLLNFPVQYLMARAGWRKT